jgi:hypothetical protein
MPGYAACQLSNFELFVPLAAVPSSAGGHASDSAGRRAHHTFTYCSPFNQSEILYSIPGLHQPIAAVCYPPFVCEPSSPERGFATCEYHPEDVHYEPFGFEHGAQVPNSAHSDKDDVTDDKTKRSQLEEEHGSSQSRADRNTCYQHLRDCENSSDEKLEECMRKVWACLDDVEA